jgi:hypothetical protein
LYTLRGDLDRAAAIAHELVHFGQDANVPEIWCSGLLSLSISVLKETEKYRTAYGVKGWECDTRIAFFATYLAVAEQRAGADREVYVKKAKGACEGVFRSAKVYRYCLPEAMRLQGDVRMDYREALVGTGIVGEESKERKGDG